MADSCRIVKAVTKTNNMESKSSSEPVADNRSEVCERLSFVFIVWKGTHVA